MEAAVLVFLLAVMPSSAWGRKECAFSQEVQPNTSYSIESPGYPNRSYEPGSSCTWTATSTRDDQALLLDCPFYNIPGKPGSCKDALVVKKSQDDIGKRYCGKNSLTHVSKSKTLIIKLVSNKWSRGGKFECKVGSVSKAGLPDDEEGQLPQKDLNYWNCDCGWTFRARIVGGVETGVNEFPLMAGIVSASQRQVFCGGTIIGVRTVLTAAHCIRNRNINDLAVLVGDHDLTTGGETNSASLIRVANYVIHPEYNSGTQVNDIALVRLSNDMVFGTRVGPACLPFYRYGNFEYQPLEALGWGTTDFGGATSDVLRKVTVDGHPVEECLQAYPNKFAPGKQICTYRRGKDACQFDSGGPLLWIDPNINRYVLAGVISYGRGCGGTTPSVNTKVVNYINWIVGNTMDEDYCVK